MRVAELEIGSDSGVTLFVRDCRSVEPTGPSNDFPKTLVWVHGLGEHGGRYLHLAEELVGRGWRVVLVDLRGHGRSGGTRTHVASFDEYVTDLGRVWTRLELGADRAVLAAHSMGGLVALRAVQAGCVHPAGLVLSSPLLGIKLRVSRLKRLLGELAVRVLPKTRFRNGLDPRNMTSDEEFARQRREDPLIVRTVTASWFFAMEAAIRQASRDAGRITVPVLVLQGLGDLTTDGDVLANWLAKTSSEVKGLIGLPNHVHELLHETDWRQTLDQILEWLERSGVVCV